MARQYNRLSFALVEKVKRPGMHPDGGGLYLYVGLGGSKSWIYRFMLRGRQREMGLGSKLDARGDGLSLAAARDAAAACRGQRRAGIDPIEARKAKQGEDKLREASAMTFRECAEAYVEAHKAGWTNAKHIWQWSTTLATFAYPIIGELPVQGINVVLVMNVLEPIWRTKTETAKRLRGRIEAVLDWAKVRGYRAGDNPARWRGHLDHLLAAPAKIAKLKHHAALPWDEIGTFMAELRQNSSPAARALEFCILTAARTGEVIGARWPELDLIRGEWTIPPERMKAGQEHRVPLAEPALAVLRRMEPLRMDEADYLFPGTGRRKRPLSNMAMMMMLRRMGRGDITVHGFRSSFRDWAGETTAYPREVIEVALAHRLGDKAEQAYARGDLFQKRRRLMSDWAAHCATPAPDGVEVVPLRRA